METKDLIYFRCSLDSGHVVEGISRVPARKIKSSLEFYKRRILTIGEHRKVRNDDIKRIANEFGIEEMNEGGIRRYFEEYQTDILTRVVN